MKIEISFMPVETRTETGFQTSTTSMFDASMPKPVRVECAKLADVKDAIDAYAAAIPPTLGGIVFVYDKNPRGARACPGFKKLPETNGGRRVNWDSIPMEG